MVFQVIVHSAAFPPVEYNDTINVRDIDPGSVDMSSSYYSDMIPLQLFDDQIFLQHINNAFEDEEEDDDIE